MLSYVHRGVFKTKANICNLVFLRTAYRRYLFLQKSSFVDVCLVSKYASGFRNSHWCSVEKVALKNFAIFTGKHLHWSLFLTKLQAISRIRTEKKYLYVLVSFPIQSECGEKKF